MKKRSAPVEPQMVAAPVGRRRSAARDEDGPLKEFDWDAHLAHRGGRRGKAGRGRGAPALAGGGEWLGTI